MQEKRIKFGIQEAGCLIYIADKNLGGHPFGDLYKTSWKDLALQGALMMGELYQDDGYSIRVVIGNLTEEEKSEWTSKITWKLNIESGKMVVSGVCDEDLEDYMEDFPFAENESDYHLGCFVEIPKGEYQADIYSYPPNDLAGGWMRIESKRLFKECFGIESDLPHEKPLDYFKRTRPNENPPDFITEGYQDAVFLDFVIHLSPLQSELKTPKFENDGCIKWEYRKPEICPIGINLEESD